MLRAPTDSPSAWPKSHNWPGPISPPTPSSANRHAAPRAQHTDPNTTACARPYDQDGETAAHTWPSPPPAPLDPCSAERKTAGSRLEPHTVARSRHRPCDRMTTSSCSGDSRSGSASSGSHRSSADCHESRGTVAHIDYRASSFPIRQHWGERFLCGGDAAPSGLKTELLRIMQVERGDMYRGFAGASTLSSDVDHEADGPGRSAAERDSPVRSLLGRPPHSRTECRIRGGTRR